MDSRYHVLLHQRKVKLKGGKKAPHHLRDLTNGEMGDDKKLCKIILSSLDKKWADCWQIGLHKVRN